MAETILIVDDTPANLGVLVETLGASGYRIMVAEDGEEALGQTAQTLPDLILLDVMMPGMDGFETCRQLKSNPRTRDIPVLFMTALNETADKVRAFGAGGVDYITKPIEHEEALARVRTHLQLRRLQRDLRQEVELREKFMRIAGHDLRSPLCLILMAAGLARRSAPAAAASARHLDNITEAATAMRRVIDTFLDLRAGTDGATGRLDVNLIASGVVRLHETSAERKAIRLSTDLAGGLPLANGDASLVYQALTNLVTNALKFSPPGTEVVVATTAGDEALRVEVRDRGPGVVPAERARLFQEHARLSARPTGGEESHGLGLAIVKHLIEAHGGRVGADFPAAGGSIFWFEVPVAIAAARRPA